VRYAEFRDRFEDALQEVGLFIHDAHRVETIDLADTALRWKVYIIRAAPRSTEPFHVSAESGFEWTPVDAARACTCEEDLLVQLIGRRRRPTRTERRWKRVDLSLRANLPYGSTTSMTEPHVFGAWSASIVEKVHATLSEIEERQGQIVSVLGGHGDLEVQAHYKPDGVVSLKGVANRIPDGPRAQSLGRPRASRGALTSRLVGWHERSRLRSMRGRRVSRNSPPGSGTRRHHLERSRLSPGSRMNPRTTMTAGRRRYSDSFYCAIDRARLRSNVCAAEDWPATSRKANPAPRPARPTLGARPRLVRSIALHIPPGLRIKLN
jgi:hypothetical protein